MKLKMLLFALLFLSNVFSQNYKIEWGNEFPAKDGVNKLYLVDGKSFYGYSYAGRKKEGMTEISNLNFSNKTIYTYSVNGEDSDFEKRVELNGKIYIFSSVMNKEKTQKTLYYHEFKKSAEKIDLNGKKIASFEFDRTQKRRADFTVLVSENKQNLCVIYEASANKKNNDGVYGFSMFDGDLKLVKEGEFKDVLESQVDVEEKIQSYFLTNKGNLYIITSKTEKSAPTSRNVYKLSNDEIKLVNIDLKNNYATEILLAETENGNVMVSGFWGKPYAKGVTKGTGVKGVFYCLLNPTNEEVLSSGFNEFGEDFILQGMTDRQKEKTKKKNERKDLEPSLHNFEMREFTALADGGYFGLAEYYKLVVTTSTDPKTGATTTHYHYYYNDLIAFKMSAEGEIEWQKKIFKDQVTTNDGGKYSSFVGVQSEGQYSIIYNDNSDNYDPLNNEYIAGELPNRMKFGKKNVVALVQIDLESGEVKHKSMLGKSDLGMYIIPLDCHADKLSSSIILNASKGKVQKLGRIQF